jgi:2-hydroxychromene-2-carboxylate isomerase
MAQRMDFYFFFGSLYSYLSVMRVEALAANAGVELRWRPFNVRAIMVEQDNIPRRNPVKMQYLWRDTERRARRHGIAFNGRPPHPVDAEFLANRVGVVAALEGWCPAFSRAVFNAWFRDHQAPGERAHLEAQLRALGKDAAAVIARAESKEIREAFDAQTDAARKLGIFGAPTFAVGEEIFWGDDRLEDALDYARGATSR